jgi:hypothetical protein
LSESNQLRETTLRVDSSLGLGFAHLLSVGGELSSLDVSYSSLTEAFSSTSGGAFTSGADLLHQAGSGNLTTVYAQDAWRPLLDSFCRPGCACGAFTSSTCSSPGNATTNSTAIRLQGGWAADHQMTNRITRGPVARRWRILGAGRRYGIRWHARNRSLVASVDVQAGYSTSGRNWAAMT